MFGWGMLVGTFIGAVVGMVATALCVAAKKGDTDEQ
jgi:gas vesicle protein